MKIVFRSDSVDDNDEAMMVDEQIIVRMINIWIKFVDMWWLIHTYSKWCY